MHTCNICKYAGRPTYKSPCSECKELSKYEYENKKTNADIIRSMSDEELAENMSDWQCWGSGLDTKDWLKWLQQPAE